MSLNAVVAPENTGLAWTGERMIPHLADSATELFHWQRYLYFRPWYEGVRVFDAASGEGYGANYAANFATSVTGIEISPDAVRHSRSKYGRVDFQLGDVCLTDYSEADLVLSFETIEHLEDPAAFFKSLKSCPSRIVVSTPNRNTHSPGNRLEDKPFNQFHTIEWTPEEFAVLVREQFPDRQVRFLSQEARWPGLIREGLDSEAMYTIAVIGEGDLPKWPRLGISVPTHNGAARTRDCVLSMTKFYPGEIEFAIVANGCEEENLAALRSLKEELPHVVTLIEEPKNLGYGMGVNRGLEYLWQSGWFDYFGVSNDDVLPATDCLPQMVAAFAELSEMGHKPGVLGPVSNEVAGQQCVSIGSYSNYAEMLDRAEAYHQLHHSGATQAMQVRGLFMLIHPDCFNDVGGFDPRFGLGNFEDDDHNLRCRLAGYSLWVVDGAYLHHAGSSTFKDLKINYDLNIQRNMSLICEKWGLSAFEQVFAVEQTPEDVKLFVPTSATREDSGYTININYEPVDLVKQASDMEFAAWIIAKLADKPREARIPVLEQLS